MLIFHDLAHFAHFGSSAGGPGHQKKKSDVEKPSKNIFSKKSSRNRTRAKYEVLAPSERGERSKWVQQRNFVNFDEIYKIYKIRSQTTVEQPSTPL